MRILSIGNFGTGWDGSICDEEHIAKALEDLGHSVHRWQREEYDVIGFEQEFDFVLIAQWDGYDGMLLETVQNLSVPVVYWAFDHQDQEQPWHLRLIELADLYLSKRIADSVFPNWQWLSQDFAPSFLDKWSGDTEQDIEVLFTGSWLDWAIERNITLRAIDQAYDLTIHSFNPDSWPNEFKNVNGPLMDQDLPRLYARAKLVVSIDHTLEMGYWSDRNAQIMCCGAPVLSRYVGLSEAVFRDNVMYFYNPTDCLNKIGKLLADNKKRGGLAKRGYEYAQANLKVENRVKDLLTIVRSKLNGKG